jgi:phosphoadenosine phosphosulfate reductase
MLVTQTLDGCTHDKVQIAIDRLRTFEPPEGYWLAFSGGKDSQVIYDLAQRAGVKFEAHFSVTTVDPPELIKFMRANYPPVIYDHCDDYIHELAGLAGARVEPHFSSVVAGDPPELISFARVTYPRVIFDHPEKTMWQLIEEHGVPPTRMMRYCCEYLKERGGEGRVVVTGVRWAESARRSKRAMVESCYRKGKRYVHPIIDWADDDVWEFHRE